MWLVQIPGCSHHFTTLAISTWPVIVMTFAASDYAPCPSPKSSGPRSSCHCSTDAEKETTCSIISTWLRHNTWTCNIKHQQALFSTQLCITFDFQKRWQIAKLGQCLASFMAWSGGYDQPWTRQPLSHMGIRSTCFPMLRSHRHLFLLATSALVSALGGVNAGWHEKVELSSLVLC